MSSWVAPGMNDVRSSTRTSFPLLSHRLLSLFCPWALRRLRRAVTLRQLSVACTLLVPANIRATTRRYGKVRHKQITLRHAIVRQICYPSKVSPPIVGKLASLGTYQLLQNWERRSAALLSRCSANHTIATTAACIR